LFQYVCGGILIWNSAGRAVLVCFVCASLLTMCICTGDEAAESVRLMERRIESAGRYVDWRRGDFAGMGEGK
jgi:hypothetical protein